MSCETILREAHARNIRLWEDGGRLRCSAPKGALTPELRNALTHHKAELLGLLKTVSGADRGSIGRAVRNTRMPLSFAQERFWLASKVHPGSSYNIAAYQEIDGVVDAEILDRAVAAIVARHEVLRTSISEHDGQPAVSIARSVPTPFEVVDAAEDASSVIVRLAQVPIDLSRAPLMRTFLLRNSQGRSVFMLVIHHIISDGWSIGVLLAEFKLAYQTLKQGSPIEWQEPSLQYADYVAWQREDIETGRLDFQLDYWARKLDGCPTVLDLPMARTVITPQTQSAVHLFHLDRSVSEEIRALCASEGATLFMVLLAIYNTLLFRYTDQASILVGVPVSNRTRQGDCAMIGNLA